MRTAHTIAALAALACLACPTLAAAEDAPPTRDPSYGPRFDDAYVADVNRHARGFGIGLDQGYWGTGYGQGLRFDIPFGAHFGARARGIIAYGPSTMEAFDPALFGTVELFGRGPVMFGLARLYGGGGVHIGGRPNPQDDGDSFGVTGGGHMGIEMFLMPSYSFSVEIGGQGNVHALDLDAGASVMGGMTLYLGGS